MRKLFAAPCVASLLIFVVAPIAAAAPTEVGVRIEGREETLFEATVPVSVRPIRASSDTEARSCDGVNGLDPGNLAPAATPTLAAAEAVESIGQSFDGQWFPGFGDYFVTRWGPDSQDTAAGAYWGVLVNEVYTSVGGCQYDLNEGDEVLWVWDAFGGRPTLALYPVAAAYGEGPRPATAIAQLGQPFPVEVVAFPAAGEGTPGDRPSRLGSSPYPGAEVVPVTTGPLGFQRIDAASRETVETGADGRATLVFTEPGLHRIKATVGAPGAETTVVRSNAISVCVPAAFGDCGEGAGPASSGAGVGASRQGPPAPGAPRIGRPRVDRSELSQGRVRVTWRVLAAGAGVAAWRVASKRLGAERGKFVVRAKGRAQTEAVLRLPRGATYALFLALTDGAGRTTVYPLGKVTVPRGGGG
jgi:Domain of unknown function (DUF4430)